MFSLEAELFKKQQEFAANKSSHASNRARTIRKLHKIKSSADTSKTSSYIKNPGVEARNEKDVIASYEEEDKESKVEAVLKAKAKLYEKLTSGEIIPSEESSAAFLVDFEQKSIESWRTKREGQSLSEKPDKPVVNVDVSSEIKRTFSAAEDEWVEYVDALGRTRKIRRKDLYSVQKMDRKLGDVVSTKTLMSDDMRREAAREEWEEQVTEEMNGPMHYENLRQGEIRELGVGYYSFSTDQETRDAQMKLLLKMREDTKKEKENLKEMQQKKRSALQARLEKVRERRIKKLKSQGLEIPLELQQPVQLSVPEEPVKEEKNPEELANEPESSQDMDLTGTKSHKLREWDKGKEWLPAAPIQLPKSWKDPREERLQEFAPPSFYYNNKASRNLHSTKDALTINPPENLPSGKTEENNVSKSPPSNSANEPAILSDIETRTGRVLDFVDKSLTNENQNVKTSDASDLMHQYNASTTDKPIVIKVKPMKKKTKNLIAQSVFDKDS